LDVLVLFRFWFKNWFCFQVIWYKFHWSSSPWAPKCWETCPGL